MEGTVFKWDPIYGSLSVALLQFITVNLCFDLFRFDHSEKSRITESAGNAGSRSRERTSSGSTQKKRHRYAWTRLLLLGRRSPKKLDTDMEMRGVNVANENAAPVSSTRTRRDDTVISNPAAASSRAGGESSRQRSQHHYEAIPADIKDRATLGTGEKDSELIPRPGSRRRRHSIGGMTTSSDTSTVGDLANVNVNGAAFVYGLGAAARSGRSRRQIMQRQVSHEAQICPHPTDAPGNTFVDPSMVRSYAASVDSDGRINPVFNRHIKYSIIFSAV